MVKGVAEGATEAAVAEQLLGQGIAPLDITARKAGAGGDVSLLLGRLFKEQVTHNDILMFSRQLYTLLKAGVPIIRALTGLQESTSSKPLKDVLQEIRGSLESGRDLSVSLARQPKVFTPFYLAMVRVGEFTGRLEEVFLSLAQHLEFEKFMRDQVKAALRYPSFVVAAMAIAIVIVNIWVIPVFAKVFQGFGAPLPPLTRLLIGFSNFMVSYWYLLALGVVLLYAVFQAWVGTTAGRYQWDRIKLKFPVAGKIMRKATLARFSRSFALAMKSGVPIVQAMAVVAQTVDNAFIADKVDKMRDGVERGDSILRTAIAADVFTPVVIQMLAVGEESGSLEEMMQEVADMYQGEVEY
ncbi:MAG: MSHA biogenesis protein MshG, partial [Ignavibacteria bacterium RIFCSPLOWO2_02_FULL_55_14]